MICELVYDSVGKKVEVITKIDQYRLENYKLHKYCLNSITHFSILTVRLYTEIIVFLSR